MEGFKKEVFGDLHLKGFHIRKILQVSAWFHQVELKGMKLRGRTQIFLERKVKYDHGDSRRSHGGFLSREYHSQTMTSLPGGE
jgi:hypothetical protein